MSSLPSLTPPNNRTGHVNRPNLQKADSSTAMQAQSLLEESIYVPSLTTNENLLQSPDDEEHDTEFQSRSTRHQNREEVVRNGSRHNSPGVPISPAYPQHQIGFARGKESRKGRV
eukprot:3794688-Amphidinium_carterae.2